MPDGNRAVPDIRGFRPQIGGKAVLPALPEDGGGDPCNMEAAPGNIRRGQHQRPCRKGALGPDVSLRKGAAPVALRVSGSVLKHAGNTVDLQRACHRVAHTEYAVAALQKGRIAEGAHDIVTKGRERAEPERARCAEAGRAKMQVKSLGAKAVFADGYLHAVPVEGGAGERNAPGGGFRDELDGAGGFAVGPVNGGDNGQGFFFRLALIVPAAKMIVHGKPPAAENKAPQPFPQGLGSRTKVKYTD